MIGNFYYLADAAGDHGSDDGERGGAQSSFVFLLLRLALRPSSNPRSSPPPHFGHHYYVPKLYTLHSLTILQLLMGDGQVLFTTTKMSLNS